MTLGFIHKTVPTNKTVPVTHDKISVINKPARDKGASCATMFCVCTLLWVVISCTFAGLFG